MAKIVAEFDTVDKTLSVVIDGTAVDNVVGVDMHRGYCCDGDEQEFRCNVSQLSEDKDNKLRTFTHLMASEDGSMVVTDSEKQSLEQAIASYFGSK